MTQASEPQNSNTSENAGVARAAAGLKLYDTASHTVSRFTPIRPGQVGIYVCGATVQSSPHIGHIRAVVAFDVVRRWMLRLGYQVTFVRNVTDIDDKILDKAAAAGQQWWARAYFYEREFTQAYDTLGVLPPTYEPRATGHMIDMIDLIRRIIDNGHGYVVYDADGKPTGNVYFDVASWPHYGELTHQKQGAAEADEAGAMGEGGGGVLPHGQRLRTQAGRHGPARRGGRGDSRQDRTEDHARDGHQLRHPARERLPQVQLVQRRCRQGVRQRPGQGLLSRRTLAEARHGRHRVQGPVGQGLLCPSVRLRQQGDRVLEHIAVCEHGAAKGDAGRPAGEDAGGASPVMHSDMDGSTSTTVIARRSRRRASSRACRERQLHRQRRDRAGLRPYQGRVLPRAELESFEEFKERLEAYIVHWNTRRRQVKLKGLTPEEFRNQSLAA